MERVSTYAAGEGGPNVESSVSAVAWPAIMGGAFAAAAVSLLLLALGSGLGLSSVSPWSGAGSSATTFTVVAAIWLIVVQWLSAGLGGYLTGRLRTKWAGMHSDEVFFRDTAHGFLAWAVASVITVAFLVSGAASVVSGGAHMASTVVTGAATGASQGAAQAAGAPSDPMAYYGDMLFRSDRPAANTSDQDVKAETGRLLAMGIRNGSVPDGDKAYLAQLVGARAGLSKADAEKRVNDVLSQVQAAELKARQAAEQARKAAAYLSFYTFFSMLIGAFIASVAGALGGHQRDEY